MHNEILRPGIVLFLVTAVAAACLGTVYGITKEPIENQRILTRNAAMRELLPEAEDFAEGDIPTSGDVTGYFTGTIGADAVGYIISASPTGYAGAIDILVALDPEGFIKGVKVVNQTETPGLGANAKDEAFTGQFIGKLGQLSVTKTNAEGQIQAITSATITSDAVVSGVNDASKFFEDNLRGVN